MGSGNCSSGGTDGNGNGCNEDRGGPGTFFQ